MLTLKDDWKAVADHRVERSLYERACGYSHTEDKIFIHEGKPIIVPTVRHYPPDPTSMIFWIKNRQPEQWRDKVEHGGASIESLAETLLKMADKLPG